MFWHLPTSVFLGSASALVAGSMMIHLQNNFEELINNNSIACNPDSAGSCKLTDSYGTGILAINIISVVFNVLLFTLVVAIWRNIDKDKSNMLHRMFILTSLSIIISVATGGYNLFLYQNFGKEFTKGHIVCDTTVINECKKLSGSNMNVSMGLNATTVALSGLVLISNLFMVSEHLDPHHGTSHKSRASLRPLDDLLGKGHSYRTL